MKVLLVGEGPSELGGALESLVRRLGLGDAKFQSERVSRADIHAVHGKGRGYFKRAVRWMLEAEKHGFDAIVLVVDQDGRKERTSEISEAQEYGGTPIQRALGVAIETLEAWLLADDRALTHVLGNEVSRQQEPETIGKLKLKPLLSGLIAQSNSAYSVPQIYRLIAQAADLSVLESRCSKGFAVFAGRVRAISPMVE